MANANYNALQVAGNMRASHGVTFIANYTFSRSIDDGGTFRRAIPFRREPLPTNRTRPCRRIASNVACLHPISRSILWYCAWACRLARQFSPRTPWSVQFLEGSSSPIFQDYSGSPLAIT